jgi:hypothetical protein
VNELTEVQELKLVIMAEGVRITEAARQWIAERTGGASLSSADYASTSGVILRLDDDVWVNAPFVDNNPNFVHGPGTMLDVEGDGLIVVNEHCQTKAEYCCQPDFQTGAAAERITNLVVTHGDRARLSPIRGCAVVCSFCNIPYEFPSSEYLVQDPGACIEALEVAIADEMQPARHILVSGGTLRRRDYAGHAAMYQNILREFQDVAVDIMMMPIPEVLPVEELLRLGVNELSINIEVWDPEIEQDVARGKSIRGRDSYLEFIAAATRILGPGRVRSMLMVGLEPWESTLEGVREIAKRGGVPVLSPFRPDPATPLRDWPPSTAGMMRELYLRAREAVDAAGTVLGPLCPPCTHNTIGYAVGSDGHVRYPFPLPRTIR